MRAEGTAIEDSLIASTELSPFILGRMSHYCAARSYRVTVSRSCGRTNEGLNKQELITEPAYRALRRKTAEPGNSKSGP